MEDKQQQHQPGPGEEGDFAVHASVYGKVQGEAPRQALMTKERRRGRGKVPVTAPAGLSSYLCRLYPMAVSLSKPGGWYPPHHSTPTDCSHLPARASYECSICTKGTVLSFLIRSTDAMHHVKVTARQG